MSVTYLTTPIAEARRDEPPRGSGMTRDGYTKRSGAPSSLMIRLQGEKGWRRLMVWQFSNMGTMFVRIRGVEHIVRESDIPPVKEEGTSTKTTSHLAKNGAKKGTSLDARVRTYLSNMRPGQEIDARGIARGIGGGVDPLEADYALERAEKAGLAVTSDGRWFGPPSGQAAHATRKKTSSHLGRKKSAAQIQREIDQHLGARR